jgi:polar amino acid transport system substrate-binding protein
MIMRRTVGFLAGLLPALIGSGSAAAEELRLVIGDWCPYECTDPEPGALRGFVTDIAVAVLSESGVQPVLVQASFARGIRLVMQNQAQVLVGVEQADAPALIYPKQEQGLAQNAFFVRAGNPWRYEDLHSVTLLKSIGILRDVDYAEINAVLAKHPDKFDALPPIADERRFNARRNLERLIAGRVDAIIQHEAVVEFELHKLGKRDAVIEAGRLQDAAPTYVAFSPLLPGAQAYAELMSRGTEKLRASGQLAEILAKYGLKDWRASQRRP